MAKVTAPLMSISASGQFAKTLVFDKRGHVREYVIPANPQTAEQMSVRNSLADIQAELKLLGVNIRAELKSGFGYRWNSMIIKELMANGNAQALAYAAEWNAFVSGDKTAWASADTVTPLEFTDGALLYMCASAVYDIAQRLGVTVTLTQPATANSATVAGEWTD